METVVNVLICDRETSKPLPEPRNGTPLVGSVPYWPTVTPPVPVAVTAMDPSVPVLVAVADPLGLVFDPLAQPLGTGRPGAEPASLPPQGGGAVDPEAIVSWSVAVAESVGKLESLAVNVRLTGPPAVVGVP